MQDPNKVDILTSPKCANIVSRWSFKMMIFIAEGNESLEFSTKELWKPDYYTYLK